MQKGNLNADDDDDEAVDDVDDDEVGAEAHKSLCRLYKMSEASLAMR